MKTKIFSHSLKFLLLCFFSLGLNAQTPDVINYQVAIKNAQGVPLSEQMVTVNVQIQTDGGTFTQSQDVMTDAFGIANLQIGGSDLKNIDWSRGNARMSVSIASGANSLSLGTQELASVPYALYAESSGSSLPGPAPMHEWDGTRLRFEQPDGSFGDWVDLKGEQGNSVEVVGAVDTPDDLPANYNGSVGDMLFAQSTGDGYIWTGTDWVNIGRVQGPEGPQGPRGLAGDTGPRPDHEWNGTSVRFQRPNGNWGPFTDLLGPTGDKGDKGDVGETGLAPEHQWNMTALRFRNPDGSWGDYTNLVGPEGSRGPVGPEGPVGPGGPIGPVGPVGPAGPMGPEGPAGNYTAGPGIMITSADVIGNTGDIDESDDLVQSTTFSGEVEGTFNNLELKQILGQEIEPGTPGNGQVLISVADRWQLANLQDLFPTVYAGGVNPSGIVNFNSTGNLQITVTNSDITVSEPGVSFGPGNCSAIATGRNGNEKVLYAQFQNGNVVFKADDNEAVHPFNFVIIYQE
jgi:hypothetical protein